MKRISTPPLQISIHAPAMGATADGNKTTLQELISIHAPAMGATLLHATPFQ